MMISETAGTREMAEKTYSSRDTDVLGEQDALRLDDEEVDELVDIADHGVEGLLGNGVVLARAKLGR